MKVLTRYILNEFAKPFLLSLGGFSLIFLIVQIFTDTHLLMEFRPTFWQALRYFFFFVPGFMVQTVPIACLFGVLFSMGALSRGNELIAMRSGGVNIFQVAAPLLAAGALIGTLSLLFAEGLVPKAERLKHYTVWVEISKHHEEEVSLFRQNLSLIGIEGGIYHIGSFDGSTNTMTDVMKLDFDRDTRLRGRLDAQKAVFEGGQWVFLNGYHRLFDEDGNEVLAQPFDRWVPGVPERPSDFLTVQKEPHQLNILELSAYIRQLRHNGSDYHKELVTFYSKLASPFGCVILAMLGIPWGWTMRKYTGTIASFGICVLVAFAYIGGMQIGQHLGDSGLATPFLATWTVNILFSALGPFLLFLKDR